MNFKELLENISEDTLLESTYDVEALRSLVDEVYPRLRGKEKGKFDITNSVIKYFPFVTKSSIVQVVLKKSIAGLPGALGGVSPENLRKENKARLPVVTIEMVEKTTSPRFKKFLYHEFIHMLDSFRSYKKNNRKFPYGSMKKKFGEEYLTYRKDHAELNQAINELKKYKDLKEYNRIKTVDALMKYVFVKTSAEGKKSVANDMYINKHFIKDADLRRKLVNRLAREDLLPEAMKRIQPPKVETPSND